jgi:voltage-gated potassium channel
MGQEIVREFRRHGVPHVVVESNPEQLPKLEARNVPFVKGRATEDEVLLAAGIERAKGLIAVAATDEENVFIVLTARGLNPNLRIVARSIQEENESKLRKAGADLVMSPYILGGRRMAAAILKPGVVDFLDLLTHAEQMNLDIRSIDVRAGSTVVGKSILESGIWQQTGATVLAIRREGDLLPNPGPAFVLQEQDELILMGNSEQLDAAEKMLTNSSKSA